MTEAQNRLEGALGHNHELAEKITSGQVPNEELVHLQAWQRARLAGNFADLLAEPQFVRAGHFFLEELYGGLGFIERDQQVARVLPVMTRLLSKHMIDALAQAFELQALSIELDIVMAEIMQEQGLQQLDEPSYIAVYRQAQHFDERARQLKLIGELGYELIELVQHPLILKLVHALRFPARLAGFALLQDFLEEGLLAFQEMKEGQRFIDTIIDRESAVLQGMAEGRDNPFQH